MQRFIAILTCLFAVVACSKDTSTNPVTAPQFIGSDQCADCHRSEYQEWLGSHHEQAMAAASPRSVLGDFSGITAHHRESSATFSQRDNRYFVETEDETGERREFEVTHTFGVTPLQQYLVETSGGRLQALQFAWDARSETEGGQRWYHLYPDEAIEPDDPLHWTGRYFNWNFMCAECHSTNLVQNYDIATDSFATTFSEISVGCEACHGPASQHLEQANADQFDAMYGLELRLNDRANAAWVFNTESGIAESSSPNKRRQEPETCGRCHARRSPVATSYEHGQQLTNTHMPSLLEENLYHADGRILDEVYVYGSFVQSKMYAAGVTCSDCHNPHSGQLHTGSEPNAICATCHLPERFATTRHSPTKVGDCVSCHMSATPYMVVDPRRDHSFRLPDTDTDPDHYGAAIAAGRSGNANATLLTASTNDNYPDIARATMLTLLEPVENSADAATLLQQLDDNNPLVRVAALRALRQQAPQLRMQHGSHLLRDPIRAVRIEAAVTYADERDLLPLEDSRAFVKAVDESRAALRASASMPESAVNLAEFEARLGNSTAAAELYEHAIRIGPGLAAVQYAYGLHRIRTGRGETALPFLQRAAVLDENTPRFAYAYGIALNSLGDAESALDTLQKARHRFPEDFEIGWALATIYRDLGERDASRTVALELQQHDPDNPQIAALLSQLAE